MRNRHAGGGLVDFVGEKGFKSLVQVIFFSAVLLFLLDSKTQFPVCCVCQNLFWQVSGSIIIDCQISINDLISVCVRACVCVYRARGHLVQQQRGRQQRMCSYKTDPWANSAHTSFTWWEPRSCVRLCARRCVYTRLSCIHEYLQYLLQREWCTSAGLMQLFKWSYWSAWGQVCLFLLRHE